MHSDTLYIRRCFELAQLGAGRVSPNPVVGAVLADAQGVIAEGKHEQYGGPHAEVHCLSAVAPADRSRIGQSTLYCSLEPCFHYGKTPPCADAVLRAGIPRVVISNLDPNPLTAGQSVQKLRAAGVEVVEGVLEAEGRYLNRAFFTWITEKRPYVILKWAQSSDGLVGRVGERTPVSGAAALRYVHRLRSEVDAILVGSQTALTDNPRLDTRLCSGAKPPLRIAFDRSGQLPASHHLLDDSQPTWIFGPARYQAFANTVFQDLECSTPRDISALLGAHQKAILLVEGGPKTHRHWLESGLWDEIIVIENDKRMGHGISAPVLPKHASAAEYLPEQVFPFLTEDFWIQKDRVRHYLRSPFLALPLTGTQQKNRIPV